MLFYARFAYAAVKISFRGETDIADFKAFAYLIQDFTGIAVILVLRPFHDVGNEALRFRQSDC